MIKLYKYQDHMINLYIQIVINMYSQQEQLIIMMKTLMMLMNSIMIIMLMMASKWKVFNRITRDNNKTGTSLIKSKKFIKFI